MKRKKWWWMVAAACAALLPATDQKQARQLQQATDVLAEPL